MTTSENEPDRQIEPVPAAPASARALTAPEFQGLAEMPAELEWFANLDNPRTRKAYRSDVADFMTFVGIHRPEEFRLVTRSHFITWRGILEERGLSTPTIRRKLSALSSLFAHLCDSNAVTHNPVLGVKRPRAETAEGKTPALGDGQARALLNAPPATTLKGKRDRAILATFLFHGLRCDELCQLKVRDLHLRRGVLHLRVHGKGNKLRFIPAHAAALEKISDYLEAAGHGQDQNGHLFRPGRNPRGKGKLDGRLSGEAIYARVVKHHARSAGVAMPGFCTHSLRATAATNALDREADIAKVQEWLGHANIATTRLYDRRKTQPGDSPTFNVAY